MADRIEEKISFLGAGNIAGIWLERFLSAGILTPDRLMACDVNTERLEELRQLFGVQTSSDNREGARFASIVVLAPPPDALLSVAREILSELTKRNVLVSLAAGIPLARLEELLGEVAVVRIMPNIPALVGEAMNLVSYGRRATPAERARIEWFLDRLGSWFQVLDPEMNAWGALCSVGPTFMFPVLESLASSASSKGIAPDKALAAAAQVMIGAARMVKSGIRSPAELKQMISLRTLREGEAARLFAEAFEEATRKLDGLTRRLADS